MLKFPQGFLWGAATSAYQVEGDNINCDWWQWEKTAGKEHSGKACLHYEFYRLDFDLSKELGHNCHRLSIEWSRIEPQEGKFSEDEIRHYQDVISSLKERGLEPIVTLHHFTNPLWFARLGGWENPKSAAYFLRFVEKILPAVADKVKFWVTINEPMVYIYHSYLLGLWPPQEKSYLRAWKVLNNLILAHIKAYRLIHKIYKGIGIPKPCISIAQNMQAFLPCTQNLKDRFAAYLRNKWYNFWFLDKIMQKRTMDFIGVNYYSRQLVEVENWGVRHLVMDVCEKNHHPLKKNSLGWDIYPEGLCGLLLRLNKYSLPIIITENGMCTEDDSLRWDYISAHLKAIHLAIER
ncbi:MAG: glycoside hydrolase family 1 protein, partial [Candidatus Omnitrophota bacterium]